MLDMTSSSTEGLSYTTLARIEIIPFTVIQEVIQETATTTNTQPEKQAY